MESDHNILLTKIADLLYYAQSFEHHFYLTIRKIRQDVTVRKLEVYSKLPVF